MQYSLKAIIKKILMSPIIYALIPLILIIIETNSKSKFIHNNLLAVITLTLTFSTILISIFSATYSKNIDIKMQHNKEVHDREITLHTEGKWRFTLLLFEQASQYSYGDLFVLVCYINPYGNKILDKLINSVIINILENKDLSKLEKNLIDILRDPKHAQINDDVVLYPYSIFEYSKKVDWKKELDQQTQNIVKLSIHTLLDYDWFIQMSKVDKCYE